MARTYRECPNPGCRARNEDSSYSLFVSKCPDCGKIFCPECMEKVGMTFWCPRCSGVQITHENIVGEIPPS